MTPEAKEVLVSIASVTLCLASTVLVVYLKPNRLEALTILVVTLAAVYSLYYWLNEPEDE